MLLAQDHNTAALLFPLIQHRVNLNINCSLLKQQLFRRGAAGQLVSRVQKPGGGYTVVCLEWWKAREANEKSNHCPAPASGRAAANQKNTSHRWVKGVWNGAFFSHQSVYMMAEASLKHSWTRWRFDLNMFERSRAGLRQKRSCKGSLQVENAVRSYSFYNTASTSSVLPRNGVSLDNVNVQCYWIFSL